MAMEMLRFNPYTLSISYNYRGVGDRISGDVRIWHSHGKMPENINDYEHVWPGRRAWPGKVSADSDNKGFFSRIKGRLIKRLVKFKAFITVFLQTKSKNIHNENT